MNEPSSHSQPSPSRMLRRAERACNAGEFVKAERLYGALLQTSPNNFDVLHGLGQPNFRRGRLDAALAFFQEALKSDLCRADGFSSLGLVFHALKQLERRWSASTRGCGWIRTTRFFSIGEASRPSSSAARARRSILRPLLGLVPDDIDGLGNRGNALISLIARPRRWQLTTGRCRSRREMPSSSPIGRCARRLDRPHEAVLSANVR